MLTRVCCLLVEGGTFLPRSRKSNGGGGVLCSTVCMYLDALGAAGVLESAQGFLEVAGSRRQRGEHGRERIPAQALL